MYLTKKIKEYVLGRTHKERVNEGNYGGSILYLRRKIEQ
jgi:hypothetical protein